MKAIKSCRNSKALGSDKLSIFHLKHLGPRAITLVNLHAKVLESLFLPTINKYIIPDQDQHGFRREHSTTSALLQLTTDVAVGFNQRKPPDRTVCVAVDLYIAHINITSKNTPQDPTIPELYIIGL